MSGGGFVICTPDGATLSKRSWRWKASQSGQHSNIRELNTLLEALKKISKLFSYFVKVDQHTMTTRQFDVKIFTDNKSTAAWAQGKPVGAKGLEARMVARRVAAVEEELRYLRSFTTVTVSHVSGKSNTEADRLSRLLEVEIASEPAVMLFSILQQHLDKPIRMTVDWDVGESSEDVCQLLRSRHQASRAIKDRSLVSKWASDCWDLEQLLRKIATCRLIIRSWRGSSPTAEPDQRSHLVSLAKSLQAFYDPPLNHRNFAADGDGIWKFSTTTPDGSTAWLIVSPKEEVSFALLVYRTFHRLYHHPGAGSTVQLVKRLSGFHFSAFSSLVKSEVSKCVTCQQHSAQQLFRGPAGLAGSRDLSPEEMSKQTPFSHVGIDVLSLLPDIKVLTVVCFSTKYSNWVLIPDESSTSICAALEEVQLEEGGFTSILSDGARCFISGEFQSFVASRLSASHSVVDPRSPWAGYFETLHRLGLRAARSLLRVKAVYKSLTAASQDAALTAKRVFIKKILWCLNHRPLSLISSGGQVITPDDLRFGYCRRRSLEQVLQPGEQATTERREAAMKVFMAEVWPLLRLKTEQGARGSAEHPSFESGDLVLVYSGAQNKCLLPWKTASVVQRISSRRFEVRWSETGRVSVENAANLLHLRVHSD
jgi:hypothetical protein